MVNQPSLPKEKGIWQAATVLWSIFGLPLTIVNAFNGHWLIAAGCLVLLPLSAKLIELDLEYRNQLNRTD